MQADVTLIDPTELAILNTFAFVPDAPLIEMSQGVSQMRGGMRLFAIGRKAVFDYSNVAHDPEPSKGGRFAILIAADGSDILATWVPEPEVRKILSQVKSFDPAAQALPFPNAEGDERAQVERRAAFDCH